MQIRTVLTIALAGLLLVGGVSALGQPQEKVTLTAENATTTAGNTAEITVVVTNTGNKTVGGNYTVAVNQSTLSPRWSANVTNKTIVNGSLQSNESRSTVVHVSVPENTSVIEDTIRLNISSGDHEWANTTAVITVEEPQSTTAVNNDEEQDDSSDTEDDENQSAAVGVVAGGGGGGGLFPSERGVYFALWGFTLTKLETFSLAVVVFATLVVVVRKWS